MSASIEVDLGQRDRGNICSDHGHCLLGRRFDNLVGEAFAHLANGRSWAAAQVRSG
jgi:hypothetical protein